MKANIFLLTLVSLLFLQLYISQKESILIPHRLGNVLIRNKCKNTCNCKGYPNDKVCCERRGIKDKDSKKCYPCRILGGPGGGKKIYLIVIGQKYFIKQPSVILGNNIVVPIIIKVPLRYVKIYITKADPDKYPTQVDIFGKCDKSNS